MITVFLFTGGYTGERIISLRSAKTFAMQMDQSKYKVFEIDVTREKWLASHAGETVSFNHENCSIQYNNHIYRPDVALIVLHGPPGENGWLQGYLSMQNVPYTTGDTLCMAITFDKKQSIELARRNGISVAKSGLYKAKNVAQLNIDELSKNYRFPVFVKPNTSGSSLGVSKVHKPENLAKALELAAAESPWVMIEEFLEGTEVTCGVYRGKDGLIALPPTEIRTHNEFFDFKAKYEHASDEITPAEIPAEWILAVQEAAKKAYLAFDCRGVVRVDFMVSKEGVPFMIEPNTVPGMSAESIIPQQLRAAGIPFTDMLEAMIEEALSQ